MVTPARLPMEPRRSSAPSGVNDAGGCASTSLAEARRRPGSNASTPWRSRADARRAVEPPHRRAADAGCRGRADRGDDTPGDADDPSARTKRVLEEPPAEHASPISSNADDADREDRAPWYCGIRNGRVWRMPPRNVPTPVIEPRRPDCRAGELAGVGRAPPRSAMLTPRRSTSRGRRERVARCRAPRARPRRSAPRSRASRR